MTRKEFIQKSLLISLGFPFLSSGLLQACSDDDSIVPNFKTNFNGKVIIIGAGAAGMSAGYLLKRYGVDFEIIEASPFYGGRVKKLDNFTDFPIDIGAEWIHTNPKVLNEIIDNPKVNVNIETIDYSPQDIKTWNDGKLKSHNYIRHFFSEWKFKNSTWFDFFEEFIIPDISDRILLNKPISEINYETDKVILKAKDNEIFNADKVLITTSLKILQNNQINFIPELPNEKLEAINKVFIGDGIKIFIEFKEKFYPDILAFGNIYEALDEEEKFVYDAAFKKDSNKHILGLFAINEKAKSYTQLATEEEIIAKFLKELDEIFEGKATANYIKHIIQNWSKEPYIQGAYSYSFDRNQKNIMKLIQNPVNNKIYFAGEAFSIENQATVNGACESAKSIITTMMKNV